MTVREWIADWFEGLGRWAAGIALNLITWTRRTAVGYRNIFVEWQTWSWTNLEWWLSWAPWPVTVFTDWFKGWCKDNIINPIFEMLKAPCTWIRDEIDGRWDNNVKAYRPCMAIEFQCLLMGDTILYIYDIGIGYADQWGGYLIAYADLLGSAIWTSLNALDANWALWRDWLGTTLAPLVDAIDNRLTVARQDLDDVRTAFYAITADPAKWIWDSIKSSLAERVRLWLISIW
jgi:hypothetical protein